MTFLFRFRFFRFLSLFVLSLLVPKSARSFDSKMIPVGIASGVALDEVVCLAGYNIIPVGAQG